MLSEINIRNFAIIDELALELAPGLNVLTGETGAGKSIIIDAVSAVLGERISPEVVRAGASSAIIEATFTLPDHTAARLEPLLTHEELRGEDSRYLTISREVRAEGRSSARVNGRSTAAALLREIGEALVDIHGQTEHLSLLRVIEHINYLDRYAHLTETRAHFAKLASELGQLRAEIRSLRDDSRARLRRLERLRYETEEINQAKLQPGEDEELRNERTRLANAEKLLELAALAYSSLYEGQTDAPAAVDLFGQTIQSLSDLERIDSSLATTRAKAEALAAELEDLADSLRSYRDSIEYNPERLSEVEERLALIANLKRKYGASIAEIIAYGEKAAAELDKLSGGEERIAELEQQESSLLKEMGALALEMSRKRQEAALSLAQSVEEQLADLAMAKARFTVAIAQVESAAGAPVNGKRFAFDRTGIDQVEFMLAPNPGEPLRPLARIASGGENSRLMLALKTVLSAVDDTPTLIFDEIDTGIGGRLGQVIGEKLAGLSAQHQVICVTHLPQLAAYADTHLRVSKEVVGERTRTSIVPLSAEEQKQELAAMIGGLSEGTLHSAGEMLDKARSSKTQ